MKEHMPHMLESRKEGKWSVYRVGRVIIAGCRLARWSALSGTMKIMMVYCNGILRLWTHDLLKTHLEAEYRHVHKDTLM